jgi:hypothetical protein
VNVAIEQVLGIHTKQLTNDWHTAIRDAYGPVLASTTPPREMGQLVISSHAGLGGDLNVGPAISPNGYRLAVLDPVSGTIEQVRAFTSGKNINPQ